MDEEVLHKYLSGEATELEKKQVRQFILSSKENERLFFEVKKIWMLQRLHNYESEAGVDKALRRLNAVIDRQRGVTTRRLYLSVARYAALFLLVLSLSFFLIDRFGGQNYIVLQTMANDSIRMYTLEDGSKVWLNHSTTLRVSQPFVRGERKVYLSGEAFFEVEKDPARPFIVGLDFSQIKVLGTSFNVKTDTMAKTVETVLVSGSISLQDAGERELVKLQPGERAVYTGNGMPRVVSVDTEPYVSWKLNNYVFNNATLKEIASYLEKKYDVKIHISSGKLEKRTFRCVFNKNETLEDAMDIVTILSATEYQLDGKEIFITEPKKGGEQEK